MISCTKSSSSSVVWRICGVFFLGRTVGAALAAPVENMSEMGSSEFTARAQPCSYLCIVRISLDPELFCACRGDRSRALTHAFPNPWALGSGMCSYGYILVLRARRFFEVVFEGQPRGVALVTRMADVYELQGVCKTLVFLQNHAKFKNIKFRQVLVLYEISELQVL